MLKKSLIVSLSIAANISTAGCNLSSNGKNSCNEPSDCLDGYQCNPSSGTCELMDSTPDASVDPDGSAANHCASDPTWGECQGDTAVYCEDGVEKSLDCATHWPGTSATCEPVVADQPTPLTCRVESGSECLVEIADAPTHLPCAGPSPGCMWDWYDGVECRESVAACSSDEVGTCRGNQAVLSCVDSQPLLFDCDWMSCENGVCKGLEIGVQCIPGLRECVEGAVCENQGGGSYLCVAGGDDCPSACTSPPDDKCEWNYGSTTGFYTAVQYGSPGTCNSPPTDDCWYPTTTIKCQEDCSSGVCVEGSSCSLESGCTSPLGCKRVSSSELRCVPVDDTPEGFPCSDEAPGYRCDSHMECIWPDFETTSVCAYLCETSADCAGVGLQGQHQCEPISGSSYGWCR